VSMSFGPDVVEYTRNHAKDDMSSGPTPFILIPPPLVDTKLPPGLAGYCDISLGPEEQRDIQHN
jgi:hypothetical protein